MVLGGGRGGEEGKWGGCHGSDPPSPPPPQLPYLIDGDVKLTQSNAILRYIARKHNMCEWGGGSGGGWGGEGGV